MAVLSDILVNQAANNSTNDAFTKGQQGVSMGIELATMSDQIEKQKLDIAMRKEQIQATKFAKVEKFFDRAMKAQAPAERQRIIKAFRPVLTQMGFPMSDAFVDAIAHDEAFVNDLRTFGKDAMVAAGANPQVAGEIGKMMAEQLGPQDIMAEYVTAIKKDKAHRQAMEIAGQKAAIKQTKLDQTNSVKAQEDFFKGRAKQDLARLESVENVVGLLESGGPVSEKAAQFMLAKSIQGAGVLTDKDVDRLGGSQALENKVSTLINKWSSGRLSGRDRNELTRIAQLMEYRIKKGVIDKGTQFAEKRAKALGVDTSDVMAVLEVPTLDDSFNPEKLSATETQTQEAPKVGQQENKVMDVIAAGLQNGVPAETIKQKLEARLGRPLQGKELQALGLGGKSQTAEQPPQNAFEAAERLKRTGGL